MTSGLPKSFLFKPILLPFNQYSIRKRRRRFVFDEENEENDEVEDVEDDVDDVDDEEDVEKDAFICVMSLDN